jgi:hypothetical protein
VFDGLWSVDLAGLVSIISRLNTASRGDSAARSGADSAIINSAKKQAIA